MFSPSPFKVCNLHLHILPSSTFREEAGHYLFGLSPLLPCTPPQFLFVLKFLNKKEPPPLSQVFFGERPIASPFPNHNIESVTLFFELSNTEQSGGQFLTESKLGSRPVSRVTSVLVNSCLGQDLLKNNYNK